MILVANLILVRQQEEIHQNMGEQEVKTEVEVPETQNDVNETWSNEEVVENLPEIVLDENDNYFLAQLDEIDQCTLLNLERRDKLPKVTLTDQLKISANKLLSIYLINVDTKPEITDKLYAMGKAIGHKLGAGQKQRSGSRRQRAGGGNRRERKLNREMKELRQGIARISNQLHRRKSRRKASR